MNREGLTSRAPTPGRTRSAAGWPDRSACLPDQDEVVADYAGIEDEEGSDPPADQGEAAMEPKEEESHRGDAELGRQKRSRALIEEESHDRVQLGASTGDVRQGEQSVEDMEHKNHDKDRGQAPTESVDVNRLGISRSTRSTPPSTPESVAAQGRRRMPSAIAPEPRCSDIRFHHIY